ncbi:immediate early response gene 2 protein-like [Xyrauchen texanus]|uniref:immediate early response gene 2 protein-like n=1 Tax=Xyrauchen texanus TaxID=154827 RepID=UPI002242230C|nr:immediate early response gene 2 protein-like [Xyrauchen texanus]
MDVTTEAKQIMIQALGKMYSSRTQRGGLRLHRSLLLTLVMKSARDIYHSSRLASESMRQSDITSVMENTSQTKEHMDTTFSAVSEVPTAQCATQPTEDGQRSGHEGDPHLLNPAGVTVDKENCSPTGLDRHSRKRRSKTATEPDFLPCKKAKLEYVELRVILQTSQNSSANCGRELDSLSLVPMPRTIVTF